MRRRQGKGVATKANRQEEKGNKRMNEEEAPIAKQDLETGWERGGVRVVAQDVHQQQHPR